MKKKEQPQRFAVVLAALENFSEDLKVEHFSPTQLLDEPIIDDKGQEGLPLAFNPDYDWLHGQVLDYAYKDENYDPVKIREAEELARLGGTKDAKPAGNAAAPAAPSVEA